MTARREGIGRSLAKGGDESDFEGEAFVDVGAEELVEFAEGGEAFVELARGPALGEGGGGVLVGEDIELTAADLLAGDVAHPGEEEVHEGVTLLLVVRFDLGLDLFLALFEPGAVGGLLVVVLLLFEFVFEVFLDVGFELFENFLEARFEGKGPGDPCGGAGAELAEDGEELFFVVGEDACAWRRQEGDFDDSGAGGREEGAGVVGEKEEKRAAGGFLKGAEESVLGAVVHALGVLDEGGFEAATIAHLHVLDEVAHGVGCCAGLISDDDAARFAFGREDVGAFFLEVFDIVARLGGDEAEEIEGESVEIGFARTGDDVGVTEAALLVGPVEEGEGVFGLKGHGGGGRRGSRCAGEGCLG